MKAANALACVCALACACALSACAQSGFAGGSFVADAAADAPPDDVSPGTDALAVDTLPVDTQTPDLPAGPVLELKANGDYLGGALAVIQTAHTQLDITQFETTNGSYLDILLGAVKEAQHRGVQVRVLLDDEIANNLAVVNLLKAAGVQAKLDSPKLRTHIKLIRSEQGFVLGSTNWSQSSMQYNNETNFLVRDVNANAVTAKYFTTLWTDSSKPVAATTSSDKNVAIYADGGYQTVVQPLVKAAKTRILLCTYGMNTDDSRVKAVLADVQAAVKRGVQVQAVLDQSPADFGGDPSVNADAGKYLKTLGIDVRNDSQSVITHAKFIVIDDTVVLGSNNWGYGGFVGYHEAGVRSSFPDAVTAVVTYFSKLWASATPI